MDHRTISAILTKIDEIRAEKARLLTSIMATDYADYARKFGHLQALNEIRDVIDGISTKLD